MINDVEKGCLGIEKLFIPSEDPFFPIQRARRSGEPVKIGITLNGSPVEEIDENHFHCVYNVFNRCALPINRNTLGVHPATRFGAPPRLALADGLTAEQLAELPDCYFGTSRSARDAIGSPIVDEWVA